MVLVPLLGRDQASRMPRLGAHRLAALGFRMLQRGKDARLGLAYYAVRCEVAEHRTGDALLGEVSGTRFHAAPRGSGSLIISGSRGFWVSYRGHDLSQSDWTWYSTFPLSYRHCLGHAYQQFPFAHSRDLGTHSSSSEIVGKSIQVPRESERAPACGTPTLLYPPLLA